MNADPHKDAPVRSFGVSPNQAQGAMVLLHGRGATAEDILSLADELNLEGFHYIAPQAAGNSWYPYSFLAPRSQNEPWLTSALAKVQSIVNNLKDAGLSADRIILAGFSQGACLATEYVASYPMRYAALIAFTGGLVGPPGEDMMHRGDLARMPALFASGDPDPHVPWQRVQESADVLKTMGAIVTMKRYPGRAHTVSTEELYVARQMLQSIFAGAKSSDRTDFES
jgi:predicted esterase